MWSGDLAALFGSATFDVAIDFNGYAPFWANLLARSCAPLKAIWMHNDLAADANGTVNGRQPLKATLESLFSYYDRSTCWSGSPTPWPMSTACA